MTKREMTIEQLKSAFRPWMENTMNGITKVFLLDLDDTTLYYLHKNIEKEISNINKNPHKDKKEVRNRTRLLYSALIYFYNHFCWKIDQLKCANVKLSSVKLLSQIIKVGLLLSRGNSESIWINKVLIAIQLFKGKQALIYDALLLVKNLKTRYHKNYAAILKHVLIKQYPESVSDPLSYMVIILLLRRYKSLLKSKTTRIETAAWCYRIKPPEDLIPWLTSLNLHEILRLNCKLITKGLLKDDVNEKLLGKIRDLAVCRYSFQSYDTFKRYPESLECETQPMFVVDSFSSDQNKVAEVAESQETTMKHVKSPDSLISELEVKKLSVAAGRKEQKSKLKKKSETLNEFKEKVTNINRNFEIDGQPEKDVEVICLSDSDSSVKCLGNDDKEMPAEELENQQKIFTVAGITSCAKNRKRKKVDKKSSDGIEKQENLKSSQNLSETIVSESNAPTKSKRKKRRNKKARLEHNVNDEIMPETSNTYVIESTESCGINSSSTKELKVMSKSDEKSLHSDLGEEKYSISVKGTKSKKRMKKNKPISIVDESTCNINKDGQSIPSQYETSKSFEAIDSNSVSENISCKTSKTTKSAKNKVKAKKFKFNLNHDLVEEHIINNSDVNLNMTSKPGSHKIDEISFLDKALKNSSEVKDKAKKSSKIKVKGKKVQSSINYDVDETCATRGKGINSSITLKYEGQICDDILVDDVPENISEIDAKTKKSCKIKVKNKKIKSSLNYDVNSENTTYSSDIHDNITSKYEAHNCDKVRTNDFPENTFNVNTKSIKPSKKVKKSKLNYVGEACVAVDVSNFVPLKLKNEEAIAKKVSENVSNIRGKKSKKRVKKIKQSSLDHEVDKNSILLGDIDSNLALEFENSVSNEACVFKNTSSVELMKLGVKETKQNSLNSKDKKNTVHFNDIEYNMALEFENNVSDEVGTSKNTSNVKLKKSGFKKTKDSSLNCEIEKNSLHFCDIDYNMALEFENDDGEISVLDNTCDAQIKKSIKHTANIKKVSSDNIESENTYQNIRDVSNKILEHENDEKSDLTNVSENVNIAYTMSENKSSKNRKKIVKMKQTRFNEDDYKCVNLQDINESSCSSSNVDTAAGYVTNLPSLSECKDSSSNDDMTFFIDNASNYPDVRLKDYDESVRKFNEKLKSFQANELKLVEQKYNKLLSELNRKRQLLEEKMNKSGISPSKVKKVEVPDQEHSIKNSYKYLSEDSLSANDESMNHADSQISKSLYSSENVERKSLDNDSLSVAKSPNSEIPCEFSKKPSSSTLKIDLFINSDESCINTTEKLPGSLPFKNDSSRNILPRKNNEITLPVIMSNNKECTTERNSIYSGETPKKFFKKYIPESQNTEASEKSLLENSIFSQDNSDEASEKLSLENMRVSQNNKVETYNKLLESQTDNQVNSQKTSEKFTFENVTNKHENNGAPSEKLFFGNETDNRGHSNETFEKLSLENVRNSQDYSDEKSEKLSLDNVTSSQDNSDKTSTKLCLDDVADNDITSKKLSLEYSRDSQDYRAQTAEKLLLENETDNQDDNEATKMLPLANMKDSHDNSDETLINLCLDNVADNEDNKIETSEKLRLENETNNQDNNNEISTSKMLSLENVTDHQDKCDKTSTKLCLNDVPGNQYNNGITSEKLSLEYFGDSHDNSVKRSEKLFLENETDNQDGSETSKMLTLVNVKDSQDKSDETSGKLFLKNLADNQDISDETITKLCLDNIINNEDNRIETSKKFCLENSNRLETSEKLRLENEMNNKNNSNETYKKLSIQDFATSQDSNVQTSRKLSMENVRENQYNNGETSEKLSLGNVKDMQDSSDAVLSVEDFADSRDSNAETSGKLSLGNVKNIQDSSGEMSKKLCIDNVTDSEDNDLSRKLFLQNVTESQKNSGVVSENLTLKNMTINPENINDSSYGTISHKSQISSAEVPITLKYSECRNSILHEKDELNLNITTRSEIIEKNVDMNNTMPHAKSKPNLESGLEQSMADNSNLESSFSCHSVTQEDNTSPLDSSNQKILLDETKLESTNSSDAVLNEHSTLCAAESFRKADVSNYENIAICDAIIANTSDVEENPNLDQSKFAHVDFHNSATHGYKTPEDEYSSKNETLNASKLVQSDSVKHETIALHLEDTSNLEYIKCSSLMPDITIDQSTKSEIHSPNLSNDKSGVVLHQNTNSENLSGILENNKSDFTSSEIEEGSSNLEILPDLAEIRSDTIIDIDDECTDAENQLLNMKYNKSDDTIIKIADQNSNLKNQLLNLEKNTDDTIAEICDQMSSDTQLSKPLNNCMIENTDQSFSLDVKIIKSVCSVSDNEHDTKYEEDTEVEKKTEEFGNKELVSGQIENKYNKLEVNKISLDSKISDCSKFGKKDIDNIPVLCATYQENKELMEICEGAKNNPEPVTIENSDLKEKCILVEESCSKNNVDNSKIDLNESSSDTLSIGHESHKSDLEEDNVESSGKETKVMESDMCASSEMGHNLDDSFSAPIDEQSGEIQNSNQSDDFNSNSILYNALCSNLNSSTSEKINTFENSTVNDNSNLLDKSLPLSFGIDEPEDKVLYTPDKLKNLSVINATTSTLKLKSNESETSAILNEIELICNESLNSSLEISSCDNETTHSKNCNESVTSETSAFVDNDVKNLKSVTSTLFKDNITEQSSIADSVPIKETTSVGSRSSSCDSDNVFNVIDDSELDSNYLSECNGKSILNSKDKDNLNVGISISNDMSNNKESGPEYLDDNIKDTLTELKCNDKHGTSVENSECEDLESNCMNNKDELPITPIKNKSGSYDGNCELKNDVQLELSYENDNKDSLPLTDDNTVVSVDNIESKELEIESNIKHKSSMSPIKDKYNSSTQNIECNMELESCVNNEVNSTISPMKVKPNLEKVELESLVNVKNNSSTSGKSSFSVEKCNNVEKPHETAIIKNLSTVLFQSETVVDINSKMQDERLDTDKNTDKTMSIESEIKAESFKPIKHCLSRYLKEQSSKNNSSLDVCESNLFLSDLEKNNFLTFSDISVKNKNKNILTDSTVTGAKQLELYSCAASVEIFSSYRDEVISAQNELTAESVSKDGASSYSHSLSDDEKSRDLSSDECNSDHESVDTGLECEQDICDINSLTTPEKISSDIENNTDSTSPCKNGNKSTECTTENSPQTSTDLPLKLRQSLRLKSKSDTKNLTLEEDPLADLSSDSSVKITTLCDIDKSLDDQLNSDLSLEELKEQDLNPRCVVQKLGDLPGSLQNLSKKVPKKSLSRKSTAKEKLLDKTIPTPKRYSLRQKKSIQLADDSSKLGIDIAELYLDSPSSRKVHKEGAKADDIILAKLKSLEANLSTDDKELLLSAKQGKILVAKDLKEDPTPNTPSYNLRNRKPILAPGRFHKKI